MRKPRRLMAGLTTLPKSETPAPTKDENGNYIQKVNFRDRLLRPASAPESCMRHALNEPVPLTALQAMEFGEAERRVMAHVATGRTCAYRDDAPCEFDACRDRGCQVQDLRRQGHSMHSALEILRNRAAGVSQEYHQVTEGEFRRILHQFVTSDPQLQTSHRYEDRPVVSYRWMGDEWGFLDAREHTVRYYVSDDIEQILLSR